VLSFLTGKAGTGKSSLAMRIIAERADGDKLTPPADIICIVPEQFSFEFERNLYNELGLKRFNRGNIAVTGFRKLTEIIPETADIHYIHKKYASDEIRSVLMYRSLKNLSQKHQLEYFDRQAKKASFRKKALEMVKELSDNRITAEAIKNRFAGETSGENTDNGSLNLKMNDIAAIMTEYVHNLRNAGYRDDVNAFSEAAVIAEQYSFFKGKTVFIDGFVSFTAGELELLRVMITSAVEVIITLTTDHNINNQQMPPFSVFTPAYKTEATLRTIAEEAHIKTQFFNLDLPIRYKNNGLFVFAENVLTSSAKAHPDNGAVHIFEAADIYEEAEYAAAMIHKLCTEQKTFRFADIVLAVHNAENYAGIISGAFYRYKLPVFIDTKIPAAHQSIVIFILAFLRIACLAHPETDDYLRLLKTGFLRYKGADGAYIRITEDDVCDFDDYCYVNNIKGKHFNNPFDDEHFERIRLLCREKSERFRKLCSDNSDNEKGVNGSFICEKLAEVLADFEIPEHLTMYDSRDTASISEKRSLTGAWNLICTLIEEMHECFKTDREGLSLAEFYELFETAVAGLKLSSTPQTLDSVTLVSVAASRLNNPKCVFILGAVLDELPAAPVRDSLLSDTDLAKLHDKGILFTGDTMDKISDERFAVYNICTAASEQLFISYPVSSPDGKALFPSEIIKNAVSLFGEKIRIKSSDVSPYFYCRTPEAAFNKYIETRTEQSKKTFSVSLKIALKTVPEMGKRLEHSNDNNRNISSEIAERLYSNKLRLSATSFEEFAKCPFMFFAKRGLKLLPRERIELSALVKGNVVHYCLAKITDGIKNGRFTPENLEEAYAAVDLYMDEFLSDSHSDNYSDNNAMGSKLYKSPQFIAEYKKLRGAVNAVARHIINEFAVSKFVPEKAEYRFGFFGDFDNENQNSEPPFVIPLENEKSAVFSGSVDRVDIYNNGDEHYIRITDYKTGHKDWDYRKMLDGLDLQPLLYIFALTDPGKNTGRYKDFSPAGTLFLFAYDPAPTEKNRHEDMQNSEQDNDIRKPIGAVIDDIDVITAMEDIPDGKSGKYIPVKFSNPDKKTGERKLSELGSSVLSANDFEALREHIKTTVKNIGERVYSGDTAPLPIADRTLKNADTGDEKNRFVPCTYCSYASLCGNYPPLRDFREFRAKDKKTALQMILGNTEGNSVG
jgi:ATP-dependent helicase/nuclease subunit B